MAFFHCFIRNLYVRLIEYLFPYKDLDTVDNDYEINGIIRGNLIVTNVGVGSNGTWQRPLKYEPGFFNYIKLFVTRTNGGTWEEIPGEDYGLTTSGSGDGQWRYTVTFADPQYIHTFRIEYVHIWWVNAKLTAQIEEV